jgi:hypothetical protein
MIIRYPRGRRPRFIFLALFAVSFFTSFSWAFHLGQMLGDMLGWSGDRSRSIGSTIWAIHLFGGSGLFIYDTIKFRERTGIDHRYVTSTFPLISAKDALWLKANAAPDSYTLHVTESVWRGEGVPIPERHYVDFHDDHERVLFMLAKSTRVPPSYE